MAASSPLVRLLSAKMPRLRASNYVFLRSSDFSYSREGNHHRTLRSSRLFSKFGDAMKIIFVCAAPLIGYALFSNTTYAYEVCGTATIDDDYASSSTPYCYDNGLPAPDDGGGTPASGGGGGGGSGTGGIGNGLTVAQQDHGKNCAEAYGTYKAKPGVPLTFSDKWAFVIDDLSLKLEIDAKTTPPPYVQNGKSYTWQMIDADTIHFNQPGTATIVYRHAGATVGNLVNTLVHEYAHQSGKGDDVAQPAGDAAEAAYEADHGAKCSD